MKRTILVFFLLTVSACPAQDRYLDSLWSVWKDARQPDTTRLKAMFDFAWDGYLYTQPDSCLYFSNIMLEFARKAGSKDYQAKALNLQFNYYFGIGDFNKAMEKNIEGYKLREEIGDKRGLAVGCSNFGVIYQVQGDYANAIDYHTRSLKYNEEVGNKSGTATALHNIAHLYEEQRDIKKAIEYYDRSLKISLELKEQPGIATASINIGGLYHSLGDEGKAMEYLPVSLEIFEKLGHKPGIAAALGNLGMVYQSLGDHEKALDHYTRSLHLQEEMGDKMTTAISYLSIGSVYMDQKKEKQAISYYRRALELSREIGDVSGTRNASKILSDVYKKSSDYKNALAMHELYVLMVDSVNSADAKKEVLRQEFKYEYEKKVTADSVRAVEQKKVIAAQFKQEETQRYGLYLGLSSLLIFAGFMFNRFKVAKKQKEIIEHQKLIVEIKQREILDSIHYARRIQQSLLPNESYIDRSLKRMLKNRN